jgi:hypothetical protein
MGQGFHERRAYGSKKHVSTIKRTTRLDNTAELRTYRYKFMMND